MFDILLFDMDATLLDFEAAQAEALEYTFKKYDLKLNDDITACYNEINHGLWAEHEKGRISRDEVIYSRFDILFKKLGIQKDSKAFEDDYQNKLGEGHKLMPYAKEVVEELAKKHELYIVTNGVTKTQFSRINASGLKKYFKEIFVSELVGSQKPSKEFFDYCFEQIPDINPMTTLIIGDSLSSDIKGGNNAKIKTCWYNPKGLINDNIAYVDFEIKDLRELIDICT